MLDEFERYAVYWVPARTDGLARFGSSWMGWCAESGEPRPRHATEGMTDDIAYATRQISCHGFHGVIRAPFRLLAGRSRWSVEHALQSASEELVTTPLPDFELAVIGGQVALVPESPSRALAKVIDLIEAAVAPLAAGVVRNSRPSDVEPSVTLAAGAEQLSQLPASAAHRFTCR